MDESLANPIDPAVSPDATEWTAADVAAICRERGWLAADESPAMLAWLADAARPLRPQSSYRDSLASLLTLIFEYDPTGFFEHPETCALLARSGAREVLRELAGRIL